MEAVKRPYTIQEEIWSSLIHGIGIALSIAGLIVLVTLAAQDGQCLGGRVNGNFRGFDGCLIYGIDALPCYPQPRD